MRHAHSNRPVLPAASTSSADRRVCVCVCCRDLFIICPSLQMASHWANSRANVFLYHQPSGGHPSRYWSPTAQPHGHKHRLLISNKRNNQSITYNQHICMHSSILIRSRFRPCPNASKTPASVGHVLPFWSSTTERVAEGQ